MQKRAFSPIIQQGLFFPTWLPSFSVSRYSLSLYPGVLSCPLYICPHKTIKQYRRHIQWHRGWIQVSFLCFYHQQADLSSVGQPKCIYFPMPGRFLWNRAVHCVEVGCVGFRFFVFFFLETFQLANTEFMTLQNSLRIGEVKNRTHVVNKFQE